MAKDQNSYNTNLPVGEDKAVKGTVTKEDLIYTVIPYLQRSDKIVEGCQSELSLLQSDSAYLQKLFAQNGAFKDYRALLGVQKKIAEVLGKINDASNTNGLYLDVYGNAPMQVAGDAAKVYLPGIKDALLKNIKGKLADHREAAGALLYALKKAPEVEDATARFNQNLEAILAKDNKNN
jgi:hypothetical protein